MPKKSVWEMNSLERLHYSLSGKTLRAIILLSMVISAFAVAVSFLLYTATINREYRIKTWQLSVTAAEFLNKEEIRREAEAVVEIYDSLTEEERQGSRTEEYTSRFSTVKSIGYQLFRNTIHKLQVKNNAKAAYTALLDTERKRVIYIADGDPSENFVSPGTWDPLDQKTIDTFLNGARPSLLDRMYGTDRMSAAIVRIGNYDLRCVAGTRVFNVGKYPVFVFFDNDMELIRSVSLRFLFQFVILLMLVTIAATCLWLNYLRKTLIRPVNDLTKAANAYTEDAIAGRQGVSHFDKLDIHTGDEIENLSLTMKTMEKDIANHVRDLSRIMADRERINAELSLASRIQSGMLPSKFPAFPDREDFDIYASMTPAKEVGGDFYDFFLVDEDHLVLVIADVSGKGVPAALFMMAAMIMIQNLTQTDMSPGRVLERINRQICSNQNEEMFVTVWLGILDLNTGKVTAANAGHEYPIIGRQDGSFSLIKDKHGFVIGGMDGMKYKEYELQLEPGDKLFVYTDGAVEAMNEQDELFGTTRLVETLDRVGTASPQQLLEAVDDEVREFMGTVPQFDDLTMLCVSYMGKNKAIKEIKVQAVTSNIESVTDFINAELDAIECPTRAEMQIDMVIDEIFSNISNYAYEPDTGDAVVQFETMDDGNTAVLRFIDTGVAYNPLEAETPDVTLTAEQRKIGGLGIFLVRKLMDDMHYERQGDRNILTVYKKIR